MFLSLLRAESTWARAIRSTPGKVPFLRRQWGKVLELRQEHYDPNVLKRDVIPRSVASGSMIKNLLKNPTETNLQLLSQVPWSKYRSKIRGVQWDPVGAWVSLFTRTDPARELNVQVRAKFPVQRYGFYGAKDQAKRYLLRCKKEWMLIQDAKPYPKLAPQYKKQVLKPYLSRRFTVDSEGIQVALENRAKPIANAKGTIRPAYSRYSLQRGKSILKALTKIEKQDTD